MLMHNTSSNEAVFQQRLFVYLLATLLKMLSMDCDEMLWMGPGGKRNKQTDKDPLITKGFLTIVGHRQVGLGRDLHSLSASRFDYEIQFRNHSSCAWVINDSYILWINVPHRNCMYLILSITSVVHCMVLTSLWTYIWYLSLLVKYRVNTVPVSSVVRNS